MDDLAFLENLSGQDEGNAILKAVLPDGQVCHISDRICPYKFLDQCPLLYHAFEYGYMSRHQASIEASSSVAVASLLRYCYTGNYLPACDDDTSSLLLLHAETFKIAEDFDVPELQLLAHGNFACQIDFACCLPTPPQDLPETIRFTYEYFANKHSRLQNCLVSTLCNYCISVFFYHRLGEHQDFMKVVADIPDFGQDLCLTNMERNFQDDCAFDIIRLTLETPDQYSGIRPTLLASTGLSQDMMSDIATKDSQDPAKEGLGDATEDAVDQIYSVGNDAALPPTSEYSTATTLVHRLTNVSKTVFPDFDTDSSSDEDGFALVHRPKPKIPVTSDELMSSPELIPSKPIDVLAASGSDYPSDDEWSMV
ncbi:hypothetical protein ACN47E_005686 [Coniothyrium glycines]